MAKPLDKMTKAELIRTIKALYKRETKLLNRVAELERAKAAITNPPPIGREMWNGALNNPFEET